MSHDHYQELLSVAPWSAGPEEGSIPARSRADGVALVPRDRIDSPVLFASASRPRHLG